MDQMNKKDEDMLKEQNQGATTTDLEVGTAQEEDDEGLVIKFNKPFVFEKKEYTEIDLSGLENLNASDMIAVNKYMERRSPSGGIQVMPEVSLEYACVFLSKATNLPVEFFMQLPPKEAMKVKNRVMGFLFGSD